MNCCFVDRPACSLPQHLRIQLNVAAGLDTEVIFGESDAAAVGGHHTLEIRPIQRGVFIDGFCLGNAAATGSPTTGPGATSESSGTQSAGQSLLRNLTLPAGTRAISVAAESSLNVPMQLVLLDPTGKVVQTVNSSSGVAILEAPITKSGVYIIKTVNLSLGPLQVWTVATPWVAR